MEKTVIVLSLVLAILGVFKLQAKDRSTAIACFAMAAAGLAGAELRGLLRPRQILIEHANDTAFIGQPKRRRPPDPTGSAGQNRPSPVNSAHINSHSLFCYCA